MDIRSNRSQRKWTNKELLGRVCWSIAFPAFFLSPRLLWEWRSFLLRQFGARIGQRVRIYPTVKILIPWNLDIGDEVAIGDGVTLYALGKIKIGDQSTISQGAHLCAGTHDYTKPEMPLLKMPINIGKAVWVCADAFVGPNVEVGDNTIIGARAVVMKSVIENCVVIGNPCRLLRKR
jgi:putative colanic acid biosynthesis acetyltransferase WcaF